jgi:hypothetical protein
MDNNRIVAYSLLAHINNNNVGITDLNEIFYPIVKRSLYKLNLSGINKGILSEIKESIYKNYGLDMPFPIIRKIMVRLQSEYSIKDTNEFVFYSDGTFVLNKFIFTDYEEIVSEQEKEIESINYAYEQFALSNKYSLDTIPSLFEYLDQNRMSLSNFFANKTYTDYNDGYEITAKFIFNIKNDQKIFNILKKIYLGSVISSYLELNYDEIKDFNVEFLLDTNFIIDLLGFSSIEVTDTCKKIIDICNRLKFKISVLNVTIDETKNLLNRKAVEFDSAFLTRQLDRENIFNACERMNYAKTDLQRIASKIDIILKEKFKVHIIFDSSKYENEAKYSTEYDKLKSRKHNPEGSLHDATAIIYVKKKRGKFVKDFHEANCWFVTVSKQDLASLYSRKEYLPEIIKPEDLVNVLWLTSPKVDSAEIIKVGLTRLLSCTISNSLPNPRILKELDDNISKYAKDKIEPEDCARLAQSIANKTLNNQDLINLNEKAKKSSEDFILAINDEVKKAKESEINEQKNMESIIQKIQDDYNKKLEESISQKALDIKNKYLELTSKIKNEYIGNINNVKKELNIQNTKTRIEDMKSNFAHYEKLKNSFDLKAHNFLKRCSILIILLYLILIAVIIFKSEIEFLSNVSSILSFVAYAVIPVSWVLIGILQREFNPKEIYKKILNSRKEKIYKKNDFDVEYHDKLNYEIISLENELEILISR